MPVLSATDVTTEKLLAMDEHYCDLGAVLPIMRALREQVDWDVVRRRTTGAPFAETVLFLLERLEVLLRPGTGRVERAAPGPSLESVAGKPIGTSRAVLVEPTGAQAKAWSRCR